MDNNYLKICRYCETEFTANHLNRRYCTEECKRAAFRDKKINIRNKTKDKNRIERMNAKILETLYDKNTIVPKEVLNTRGFNFNYYIKILEIDSGILYILEYDYNLFISEKIIKIIKNSKYVPRNTNNN